MVNFDSVKVFSATLHYDRAVLGEKITDWLTAQRGQIEVTDYEVMQSSDEAFHCISIIIYYRRVIAAATGTGKPRAAAAGVKR